MSANPPTCHSCAHCHHLIGEGWDDTESICKRVGKRLFDPVSGKEKWEAPGGNAKCFIQRRAIGVCGPDGKYWER